ncbi:MAG: ABC transporter ATP-binding protein [Planctomycetota bacterium]|jgi:branched-chain amino acid transport system ATP-binding protein
MSGTILDMKDVRGGYGDADILTGLDLSVERGEVVAIIGANGAGKSTAMRAVFGLLIIRGGSITFDGTDITGWKPERVVRQGVCYVPQTNNVFPSLSVRENLEMGAFLRNDDISKQMDHVYELFPPLRERAEQPAGVLSGGQRQMVAMGRALMLEPRRLLLDEPTAGLSPKYMGEIFKIVRDVNATGVSILLVEQNAKQALAIADKGYVLVTGKTRFTDTGANLGANREIAEMFLGG